MPEGSDWSTQCVAPGKEYQFWRQALCDAVFELDVSLDQQDCFRGSIRQRPFGALSFSEIQLDCAQTIHRTPSAIARSAVSQFEFVVLLEGKASLQHRGLESEMTAGDSILIDGRQPYTFSTADLKNLSFHIPASWLDLWLPEPSAMVGKPVRGRSPWGRAILAMTSPLRDCVGDEQGLTVDPTQFGGLLSLALTNETPSMLQNIGVRCTFERGLRLLQQNAHDMTLDVERLAGMMGISKRYLHKLFASAGTSYGDELLKARLQQAMRLLTDRRFIHVPVSEIGWRSGFRDPSHFSRRFRERFGDTPGSFRPHVDPFENGSVGCRVDPRRSPLDNRD